MKYLAEIIKGMGGHVSPISSPMHRKFISFSTNASVTSHNNNIVVNTRLSNYIWTPWADEGLSIQLVLDTKDPDKKVYSYNEMGIYNSGFQGGHFVEPQPGPYKFWNMYAGLEDMRLVTWNGMVYGIGARPDVIENKVVQQLIEFTDDFQINRSWLLETDSSIEKGWLPVEDRPFTFMYDISQSIVIAIDPEQLSQDEPNHIDVPKWSGEFSGSTPLIRYKDEYICLGHMRIDYMEASSRRVYYKHYFIRFNNDLKLMEIGQQFNFLTDGIEFACGLCNHNDDVLLTFSVGDSNCHIIDMSKDIFERVVESTMKSPELNNPDPEKPIQYFIEHFDEFNACDSMAVAMGYIPKDDSSKLYGSVTKVNNEYWFTDKDKSTIKPVLMRSIMCSSNPDKRLYELLKNIGN